MTEVGGECVRTTKLCVVSEELLVWHWLSSLLALALQLAARLDSLLHRPVEPMPDVPRDVLSSSSVTTSSALAVINRISCAIRSPAVTL